MSNDARQWVRTVPTGPMIFAAAVILGSGFATACFLATAGAAALATASKAVFAAGLIGLILVVVMIVRRSDRDDKGYGGHRPPTPSPVPSPSPSLDDVDLELFRIIDTELARNREVTGAS